MPITVTERPDSQAGTDGEQRQDELRYLIRGTASGVEARNALRDQSPGTYGGHPRKTWDVGPPIKMDAANPDACIWPGTVRYGPAGRGTLDLGIGDVAIRVQIGGGREHRVVPIARRGAYAPAGETAPAAHGIGDDGKGHIAGVEVEAYAFEFEVTKVYETPQVAPDDITLAFMVPSVNAAQFTVTSTETGRSITADAGQCLLRGVRNGPLRADGGFEVDYAFAIQPDSINLEIYGTGITVPFKGAWEYLWCRYEQAEDAAAKRLYAKAIAAYLDQVYDGKDFSVLAI